MYVWQRDRGDICMRNALCDMKVHGIEITFFKNQVSAFAASSVFLLFHSLSLFLNLHGFHRRMDCLDTCSCHKSFQFTRLWTILVQRSVYISRVLEMIPDSPNLWPPDFFKSEIILCSPSLSLSLSSYWLVSRSWMAGGMARASLLWFNRWHVSVVCASAVFVFVFAIVLLLLLLVMVLIIPGL